MAILPVFLLALACLGAKAAPINDRFRNGKAEEGLPQLPLTAVPGEHMRYFTLSQVVQCCPPTSTGKPILPTCQDASDISSWLADNINTQYKQLLAPGTGNATVTTTLLQRVAQCNYSSLVTYVGSADLEQQLADAANQGKLCDALPQYCAQAFNPSGSTLQSSSGATDVTPPPVVNFNCVKGFYKQTLDHFNTSDSRFFKQVFWVCDKSFPGNQQDQASSGNIIVFLGNESPLGIPKQPIVFENAERLNALVLLVEHRYYGESMPFSAPDDLLTTAQYKYLAIQQVIEDTAAVLAFVRKERSVPAAVPAVVIGGSYGGMLASYHRVVKPDVFAAAVAASGPLTYVFGTQMWADTSNKYHEILADSLDVNTGSKVCSGTVRAGLDEVLKMTKHKAGRRQLAALFSLCPGTAAAVEKSQEAGFAFYMDVYGQFHGWVQVNDQPPLLGQVALACDVITTTYDRTQNPLQAIVDVSYYFRSNGSANWCYSFNSNYTLIVGDPDASLRAYSYQVCTQGSVYSSEMAATGSPNTLTPAYGVWGLMLRQECRNLFGRRLPERKSPRFMLDMQQLCKTGGIVFTNGDLDGWAGGSFQSFKELQAAIAAGFAGNARHGGKWWDAGDAAAARIAFVTYKGASHCTDTHSYNWANPTGQEQGIYKRQRAQAMDYAAKFMRPHK